MPLRLEPNNQAVFENEKLYLRFDGTQGGTLVDFRWKRRAPTYNVCEGKGGMWLNTSYEGISDGTWKGSAQGMVKQTRFTINGNILTIEGDMPYGDRPNVIAWKYKIVHDFRPNDWWRETIEMTAQAGADGLRFYAIGQPMDFDQSWNKSFFPVRQIWVGRSEDWRLVTIGNNDENEVETAPENDQISTAFKFFGNMRTHPERPIWMGHACGDFGLITVSPYQSFNISMGVATGYNWALGSEQFKQETPGNSWVRSIETAHIFGDGNRRYLERQMGSTDPYYAGPNPIIRAGQVIRWDVQFFPYEGRDWQNALNWVRSSGAGI